MKALLVFLAVIVVVLAGWFLLATKLPEADFVIVAGAEVDTLDPQQASWLTDFRVIECMYEPLLTVSTTTMQIEAATADKWEVSNDKLTYTFHIRDSAKWSNGDPVTAHDFIYGWQRAAVPDYASQYFSMMMHLKGAKAFFDKRNEDLKAYLAGKNKSEQAAKDLWAKTQQHWNETVGLKAKDDKTIVITLERPTAYYLEIIAFPTYCPVHKKSVEPTVAFDADTGRVIAQARYFSNPASVICNGPYTLSKRKAKSYTLLTANPNYWDRAGMGNQSVLIRVIEEPNTMLLEYEAGTVHWLPDIPTASSVAADLVRQRDEGKRKDVHTNVGAGTYFYHFNCNAEYKGKKNVLADPRIRRALSMAIDRKSIIEKITRINQPIARTMSPLNTGMVGYDPPVEAGVDYNPDAARALLAEAGFPKGQGFPQDLVFSYNTEGNAHALVAQFVQETWERELGIKVTLEGVEKNRAMEIRRNHDYSIARGGWYGDYRDPTTFLEQHVSNDGQNHANYSNAKYDELFKQAASEPDVAKRLAMLREAEAIMLREQPIAPIYQYINLNIFDPDIVSDLNPNPWNYRDMAAVKVKKKTKE